MRKIDKELFEKISKASNLTSLKSRRKFLVDSGIVEPKIIYV
jgi:hypothetical protein